MAYSESIRTLENRRHLLTSLEAGQSSRWVTDKGRAQNLARQIREALSIAAKNADAYPALARAAEMFKIEVPNSSTVQAVPKERKATVVGEAFTPHTRGSDDLEGDEGPGGGGLAFGSPQVRVGLTTADQVIDAWVKHLPSNDLMNFPSTVLPYAELEKLHRWATARTPRLMFFVPEGSLTLSVAEDGVEEHSWHPTVTPTVETFNI